MTGDRRPATAALQSLNKLMKPEPALTTKYKFQKLDVYQLALEYLDKLYDKSKKLFQRKRNKLGSQLQRAVTSIVLNIAEGSTGQRNAEQHRFLGLALRSYLQTVACLDIAYRRSYLSADRLAEIRAFGHGPFTKLQAFRSSLFRPNGLPSPVTGP